MEEENALVRLIWDFRGPDAQKTAEHHAIHLREFFERENFGKLTVDCKDLTNEHHIAYAEVPMTHMISIRDALRPNRGEYVD